MPQVPKTFAQFWSTDRGLTVLVLLLAVTVFVLPHLAREGAPLLTLLFDILFSLILLTGLTAITRTRGVIIAGTVLILVALAGRWLSRSSPGPELLQFNLAMSTVSTLILAGLVTVQVFREGPITMHRVLGAVGVYLLLGLAWSFAYHLIDVANPEAFTISGGPDYSIQSGSEFLYFSFVTLTTVGYGDITALDPAARSVVMLEALTGQLFPAILIARLVSMELVSRPADKPRSASDDRSSYPFPEEGLH
jgi:hypothetical protein